MDKDADKRYQELTPEERYNSAIEADKAPWNPLKAAKEIIVEKFGPKKEEAKPEKKYKKGGSVKSCGCKKMAKGGSVSSASKRADGIASKGKTKGRMI
jgi:hypothetical protein